MHKVWRGVFSLVLGLLLLLTLGGIPALAATTTAPSKAAAPTAEATQEKVQSRPQGSAAASATAPALIPPEIQQILDRGRLTVAVLGRDNSPFFMKFEDSQLGGLDIQIAQDLAEQLGVELEINRSAQTFDDVVDTVYRHEADLAISKISRTLKRARRVRFSDPYLKMRQGLLVNRLQLAQQPQGSSMVETIRNLSGKVGVIKESSYVGFLKQKFPQADIVEFPTWKDTVDAVVQGEILAAYRDELEVKKVVRTKPDAALQLQTIALTDTQDSLAAVLPWDSTHLLAFVDQYLETMATQYTVDLLLDEYADYWSSQSTGQS
jgi:polar amino acid transport system substrate-binding protein